ncbi:sigma-70 family RNA polymerase sigma factor [Sutcliffiella horikoshii]|uniref:sigma-70 family RNA polymerase sigma factor n=1 Tax=Sutcliffiella horikoshii TaxID=79883 RepID=UPI0021CCF311|nr:sigma-70 family RNA polymerase sigma factor [Sutcliffiella horikoshii]
MSSILASVGYLIKELVFLVSYVKNNAFPQPLSSGDEAKYLKLMAEGNEEARNLLIEHNLRLVAHIVKKFENTGEDSEDLISIGTIGLIKAIESFHSGKGTKLATYAARCIENEIVKSKGCVTISSCNHEKNLINNVTNQPTLTTFLDVTNKKRVWGDVVYEEWR